MRGKQLAEWQERRRQLEEAEAKARCAFCKAPLIERVTSWLDKRAFCSVACLEAAHEPKPRGFQRMGQ